MCFKRLSFMLYIEATLLPQLIVDQRSTRWHPLIVIVLVETHTYRDSCSCLYLVALVYFRLPRRATVHTTVSDQWPIEQRFSRLLNKAYLPSPHAHPSTMFACRARRHAAAGPGSACVRASSSNTPARASLRVRARPLGGLGLPWRPSQAAAGAWAARWRESPPVAPSRRW